MINEYNILISSVGGQGGITLARVLSITALSQGLKVRVGETLGMAQRGGSVQSHVRFGENVYGPFIPYGKSDILLSLEPSEALRSTQYIGKKTKIIMNIVPILPMSVLLKEVIFPETDDIVERLSGIVSAIYAIDAVELAKNAGPVECMNMVILGAYMSLGEPILTISAVKESIARTVPSRFIKPNIKALDMGMHKMKELMKRRKQKSEI